MTATQTVQRRRQTATPTARRRSVARRSARALTASPIGTAAAAPTTAGSVKPPRRKASAPAIDDRRRALGEFYARRHRALDCAVRGLVSWADEPVVQDACGFAWLQLVRRDDITLDGRGAAWLTIVAVREARRQLAGCEYPSGLNLDEVGAVITGRPSGDPVERLEIAERHRELVARFAGLRPRERRDLFLLAGGFRYREIAEMTSSTYTAVNRRISEGRAQLIH